ncbi:MAG: hypothetical protein IH945_04005 [Armatimonadetes bacterium]|nr:hypothetical protein [Armatimonadota bacterium]
MKDILIGFAVASFLVVSCTGGGRSVEEQAALNAKESDLIDQLVGNYKGEIYFSQEWRNLPGDAPGKLDKLDALAAARVVNLELRTNGTCTYTWTQYDKAATNEGEWAITDDLAHVILKMEGYEEAKDLIGLFAYGSEDTYEIRDDNKTLYYEHEQPSERETGLLFTRK